MTEQEVPQGTPASVEDDESVPAPPDTAEPEDEGEQQEEGTTEDTEKDAG